MKYILLTLFILKIVIAILFNYLSYIGDSSQETQNEILKYFNELDILKGEEYSKKGFFVNFISNIIDYFVIAIFTFTPTSFKLENYLFNFSKKKLFLTTILFLSIYYLISYILELPFAYYNEFIIEKQFGFSNLTLNSWMILNLKNLLLGYFSFLFMGLTFLYLFKLFPKLWIFLVPVVSVFLGLFMSVIYPLYITPLFYEYHEIENGTLKEKITLLCSKENIHIKNIYVLKESEYSNHTNAYFTGWGEERKIFLYDTLIQNHTEEEIISVLGHEIGHWKYNHQLKDIFIMGFSLFFGCILLKYLFELSKKDSNFQLKEIYNPSSLPLIFLIFSLLDFIIKPIGSYLSREDETEADREALVITNDPEAFISTEIKMARDNMTRLNPHPVIVFTYFSHPKTMDRIQLAEDFKNKKY